MNSTTSAMNSTTSARPAEDSADHLARTGEKVIAVLQRGWVVVGDYHPRTGSVAELRAAAVVRRWGTTRGLGELAQEGPRDKTKLDSCPDVAFHVREAVMVMAVDADAWA